MYIKQTPVSIQIHITQLYEYIIVCAAYYYIGIIIELFKLLIGSKDLNIFQLTILIMYNVFNVPIYKTWLASPFFYVIPKHVEYTGVVHAVGIIILY